MQGPSPYPDYTAIVREGCRTIVAALSFQSANAATLIRRSAGSPGDQVGNQRANDATEADGCASCRGFVVCFAEDRLMSVHPPAGTDFLTLNRLVT